MSTISFEPPFHGTCVNQKAILHSHQSSYDFLDFTQIGLQEMPDIIILGSKRYKYSGVSDGSGQYWEEK